MKLKNLTLRSADNFELQKKIKQHGVQKTGAYSHQETICCGRTPFETMIAGKEIGKEKFVN